MKKWDSEFLKDRTRLINESRDIRESVAYYKFTELLTIKTSFFPFRRNYIDWEKSLEEYYSNNDILLTDSLKRWYRQKVLVTKVHNVLSSALSFIEYFNIKNSTEDYYNDSFHCFIKQLRNFTAHVQYLPLISKIGRTTDGTYRFETINIDKFKEYLSKEIEEHPKWNGLKLAHNFVDGMEDHIDLTILIKSYYEKLNDLLNELIRDFVHENFIELETLVRKTENIHKELRGIGINGESPISKARLRYLKILLRYCSQNID
ncbi:hypothetical protein ZORO111903_04285 [Zobellia roscoffensis]|uniref:hypothetical protein n=1 Tax=Zobellia roscoffensis TaxID=2779508 RepID=UPI00188D124B|nr:hypothetical protein [Zobellia roscoffensis]